MSRPTRVLVTGAAGQVGQDLLDVLRGVTPPGGDPSFSPDAPLDEDEFQVVGVTRAELDVTDRDAVFAGVRATRPDVVVNLAAYTAVDRAEEEVAACHLVNERATESLSLAAHDVGAHFVTISTDYVFDGRKGGAYDEVDTTNPLNVYGRSKRAGELLCSGEDTIVRTSWVMGVRGKSVVHLIADRARAGEKVTFVADQTGTVTAASDLARALVALVRARPGGTWHVANVGPTTWFDVAHYVGALCGRGDDFATAITTDQLTPAPLARRPERSDLDTSKFANSFAALPPWRDALARLVTGRFAS